VSHDAPGVTIGHRGGEWPALWHSRRHDDHIVPGNGSYISLLDRAGLAEGLTMGNQASPPASNRSRRQLW